MSKKDKIEEILNSLNGASKAKSPTFLFTRIEARIETDRNLNLPINSFQLAGISFFMLIIISVNAFVIINNQTLAKQNQNKEWVNLIAEEYNLNNENNFYEN